MSPVSATRHLPGEWLDDIAARLRVHPWVDDARAAVADDELGDGQLAERLTAFVLPSAAGVRVLRTVGKGRFTSDLQGWLRDGGLGDAANLGVRLVEALPTAGAGAVAGDRHRRYLPIVSDVALDERGLSCGLRIPYEAPIFRGHFPGRPIVPGVMQVGWAATLARDYGLVDGPLTGIPAAKFNRLVRPGMRLLARIACGPRTGQIRFEYISRGATVATGRLQFGVARD